MKQSQTPSRSQRSLIIVGALVLAWFAFSEIATEAWFRYKEGQTTKTEPWKITFPENDDFSTLQKRGLFTYEKRTLGKIEKEILRFEDGIGCTWRDGTGNAWNAFYLNWSPDETLSDMDAAHNPTICLPATGLKLVGNGPVVYMQLGGREMPFQSWIFKQNDTPIYVFMGVRRADVVDESMLIGDIKSREGKLERAIERVVNGQRGGPLQALQLFVIGPRSIEEAAVLAKRQVDTLTDG